MPLIEVHLADGRTDEQKRALLEGITKVVQDTIGASLDSIRVWINELPPTHYMAAGEWLVDKRARAARPGG
jgi:4-oxalocrotonate tautomerase